MTGPDEPCPHTDFGASVEVNRLTDGANADATVIGYSADMQVWCANPVCGEVFRFIGAPVGVLADRPAVSVDETELHAPIRPASADPDFGLGLPGFTVNMSERNDG